MSTCIVILIFICGCGTAVNQDMDEYWPNVGTVLFSRKDVENNRWFKSDVALLQARRYFQTLIPSPNVVNPSKDFVDKLISYFRDTYSYIQNEGGSNPEVDSILTTALSDTVGGYLKLWILPVTKFAFYGGSITYDDACKLFNFYSEVKAYLGTNGEGWRSPDEAVLKSITIDIPRRLRETYTRSMEEDPCEHFAYFEKNHDGFTVPIPYVNWEEGTMFIPLKNESLITLSSPKHHNTLVKYYDVAKNCLMTKSSNASSEFDDKFQTWLSNNIVRHLADENLYVSLENVLSLVNRSSLHDSFYLCQYDPITTSNIKSRFFKIIEYLNQRKAAIIGMVLIVEIFWCVIALQHLLFKRAYEKPRSCCSMLSVFTSQNKSHSRPSRYENDEDEELACHRSCFMQQSSKDLISRGGRLRFHRSSRYAKRCKATETEYCPTGVTYMREYSDTRSFIKANEVVEIVNEKPALIKKSSLKKISNKTFSKSDACSINKCRPPHLACNCDVSPDTILNDAVIMQELEPNKIASLFRRCQKSIENALFTTHDNATQFRKSMQKRKDAEYILNVRSNVPASTSECVCECCKEFSSCIGDSNEGITQPQIEAAKFSECACVCCKDASNCCCDQTSKVLQKTSTKSNTKLCVLRGSIGISYQPQNAETLTQTITYVDKNTETRLQKPVNPKEHKEMNRERVSKNKEVKRRSKRYLEIKIDRPNTEISVGISGLGKKVAESPRRDVKESRIPKPSFAFPKTTTTKKPSIESPKYRSMIPQPTKRTMDDIVVKSNKAAIKDSKLNLTL